MQGGRRFLAWVDIAAAVLTVAIGVGHLGYAAALYRGLDASWLWFVSGGLMALYLGALNLARIWANSPRLRWVCFWCNVTFLVFVTLAISTEGVPETPLYAAAIAAPLLTSLSLTVR